MLVHAITQHPFKPKPPNLDKRCKPASLWSPLFWWAIDIDLQGKILNEILKPTGYDAKPVSHSQSPPNLRPESDHSCSMLLLFREPITSNISFTVNYQWTFRLIIDIVIDLITSQDRYFLPLCLQSKLHPGSGACATSYLVTSWDFKTLEFRQSNRAKYGIVIGRLIHSNAK